MNISADDDRSSDGDNIGLFNKNFFGLSYGFDEPFRIKLWLQAREVAYTWAYQRFVYRGWRNRTLQSSYFKITIYKSQWELSFEIFMYF